MLSGGDLRADFLPDFSADEFPRGERRYVVFYLASESGLAGLNGCVGDRVERFGRRASRGAMGPPAPDHLPAGEHDRVWDGASAGVDGVGVDGMGFRPDRADEGGLARAADSVWLGVRFLRLHGDAFRQEYV